MQGLELADADAARIPGAAAMEAVRGGTFRPGWGRLVFQLRAPYAVIETPAPADVAPPAEKTAVEPVQTEAAETVDVEDLIANDPNQIGAPPEKPKRGWWRR